MLSIEIEHQTCQSDWHTRYGQEKYEELALSLTTLLKSRLQQERLICNVFVNPGPGKGWRLHPYVKSQNQYCRIGCPEERISYPRLGSFEVAVMLPATLAEEDGRRGHQRVLLWSKLSSRRWPNVDSLVERCVRVGKGGVAAKEPSPPASPSASPWASQPCSPLLRPCSTTRRGGGDGGGIAGGFDGGRRFAGGGRHLAGAAGPAALLAQRRRGRLARCGSAPCRLVPRPADGCHFPCDGLAGLVDGGDGCENSAAVPEPSVGHGQRQPPLAGGGPFAFEDAVGGGVCGSEADAVIARAQLRQAASVGRLALETRAGEQHGIRALKPALERAERCSYILGEEIRVARDLLGTLLEVAAARVQLNAVVKEGIYALASRSGESQASASISAELEMGQRWSPYLADELEAARKTYEALKAVGTDAVLFGLSWRRSSCREAVDCGSLGDELAGALSPASRDLALSLEPSGGWSAMLGAAPPEDSGDCLLSPRTAAFVESQNLTLRTERPGGGRAGADGSPPSRYENATFGCSLVDSFEAEAAASRWLEEDVAAACLDVACQSSLTFAETLRAGCADVACGPSVLLPEGGVHLQGVDVACQSSLVLYDDDMALDRSPVECRAVACQSSLACGIGSDACSCPSRASPTSRQLEDSAATTGGLFCREASPCGREAGAAELSGDCSPWLQIGGRAGSVGSPCGVRPASFGSASLATPNAATGSLSVSAAVDSPAAWPQSLLAEAETSPHGRSAVSAQSDASFGFALAVATPTDEGRNYPEGVADVISEACAGLVDCVGLPSFETMSREDLMDSPSHAIFVDVAGLSSLQPAAHLEVPCEQPASPRFGAEGLPYGDADAEVREEEADFPDDFEEELSEVMSAKHDESGFSAPGATVAQDWEDDFEEASEEATSPLPDVSHPTSPMHNESGDVAGSIGAGCAGGGCSDFGTAVPAEAVMATAADLCRPDDWPDDFESSEDRE